MQHFFLDPKRPRFLWHRHAAHVALSLAAVSLAASPVLAHHISGTVYCDQDLDNMIDAGDMPGKLVRVSQSAFANASFVAPNGRITFGRDSDFVGCFCTDREKSDKHITLQCPAPLQ